ncbi:MAG: metallophosphoesterase, partial [Oscillospiraceae bacterium]|nr:metallophosphoesterase [Oscillospiraceae bacterium]
MKVKKKTVILTAAGLLTVWLLADLYISNFVPAATRREIRLARLPEAFSGFRVAHLSDLHATSFGKDNAALISLLEGENPDIIVITGDLIDRGDFGERPGQLDWAEKTVSRLVQIAPVYYVTGNHEWGAEYKAARKGDPRPIPRLKEIIDRHGAVWLDNDYLVIRRGGDAIVLAGITDPNGPADQVDPLPMLSDIRAEMNEPFILALSHRYDRLDEYAQWGLDLVLTGHAHGGLVRLPFTDGLYGP